MRTTLLRVASLILLLLSGSIPQAASAFDNPDGRYGLLALEPFLRYMSAGTPMEKVNGIFEEGPGEYSLKNWELGLRMIVPSSVIFFRVDRGTLFVSMAYGREDENSRLPGEAAAATRQSAYTLNVSFRLWLGEYSDQ